MPIPLPNLDDMTWEDLVAEARTRIPAYAPEWTNFNASDPGITVIELFAYHCEVLLYRLNRVGDAHTTRFLRLVNGPEWKPSGNVNRDRAATLGRLRRLVRAVTTDDYEAIGAEEGGAKVARVKCISGHHLGRGSAISPLTAGPADISVIIVPSRGEQPDADLLEQIQARLNAVKLLGTRVHVVGPRYVHVGFQATLVLQRGSRPSVVIAAAAEKIRSYFDPLRGGGNDEGWPFGRDVYVSEVYALLDGTPGVSYVRKTVDGPTGRPLDEVSVGEAQLRRIRRNALGEIEAVTVHPDELVSADVSPASFRVDFERPI